MRGKVLLSVILTVAALLFSFPVHAQEQRAGKLCRKVKDWRKRKWIIR